MVHGVGTEPAAPCTVAVHHVVVCGRGGRVTFSADDEAETFILLADSEPVLGLRKVGLDALQVVAANGVRVRADEGDRVSRHVEPRRRKRERTAPRGAVQGDPAGAVDTGHRAQSDESGARPRACDHTWCIHVAWD